MEEGVQEKLHVFGDRCDVAFNLRDIGMAVVEVKNRSREELWRKASAKLLSAEH